VCYAIKSLNLNQIKIERFLKFCPYYFNISYACTYIGRLTVPRAYTIPEMNPWWAMNVKGALYVDGIKFTYIAN